MTTVRITIPAILHTLVAVGSATAMPQPMTAARLFDVCGSLTLQEAAAKGDQLGWRRLSDAELEEWRTKFVSHNDGPVDVLGWRRGGKDGDDSLSFWTAHGPNRQRVCCYSTANTAWLWDALSERFGAPANLQKYDFGTTAVWKRGVSEVSFSQVGSSAVVYISSLH